MITTAYINIWNKRVGAIAWDDSNGLASFEYETSFLANNWDLAPLKMPIFGADKQVFSFPELRGTSTFKGLPGLLADALPDKYGNPNVFTETSSNFDATLTIPGMIPYIIILTRTIDIMKAYSTPFFVGLYFLK